MSDKGTYRAVRGQLKRGWAKNVWRISCTDERDRPGLMTAHISFDISFNIRWEKPVVEFLSGGWTGLTRDEVIRAIGELVNPICVKIIFTIINELSSLTVIKFLPRSTMRCFKFNTCQNHI